MKQSIITAGMVAIVIILWVMYEKYELSRRITCTPSQEHQEVISQLSWINERLDNVMFWQDYISDLLNK